MTEQEERDIQAMRGNIEETRRRIAGEIEAIGERLTPTHAKEVAKERMVRAKDRTIESVKSSARNVGHMANEVRGNLGVAMRENPIPTAMVFAGTGWLLFKAIQRARQPQLELELELEGERLPEEEYSSYARSEQLVEPRERMRSKIEHARERVSDAAEHARERVSGATEHARERVGAKASELRERAGHLAERGRHTANRAVYRSQNAYDHNPLAFGAGAILIGLGIGMLLPHTEREDRLLGERRERLLGKARERAMEAKDVALESAKEGMRAARETATSEAEERNLIPR